MEIAGFLSSVDEAIEEGHLIALYDSLPPKYRSDVDEVVKLASANIDNQNFMTITTTLQQLGETIVQKQNWLLSSPRILNSPPESVEAIEGPLVSLADTLRVVLKNPSVSLEKLQSTPFGKWLRELDPVLAPYLADLQRQSPSMTVRVIEFQKADKETATVQFIMGENKTNAVFKNVDGYWVPEAYAADWDEMITRMKEQYSSDSAIGFLEPYVPIVKQLGDLVTPLQNANDMAAFHSAIETVIAPVLLVMEVIAPAPPAKNLRGNSSRQGDFGEDQMRAEEEEMARQQEEAEQRSQ